MHTDVFHESGEGLAGSSVSLTGSHLNENTDAASHVDVGTNHTFANEFILGEAGQTHVFTELTNLGLDEFVESRGVAREILGKKCLERVNGLAAGNVIQNLVDEGSEVFILSHEVSFAVHFYENTGLAVLGDTGSNNTFLGSTASLLLSVGDAFLTKNSFCFSDITTRFI